MPNICAHMIVAKEVGKKIGINSDDYYRGNVLPDVISDMDSHHRIQGDIFQVPDVKWFIDKLNLDDEEQIGYLVHLLLDKHYLEDYLSKYFKNAEIFANKKIYHDYDAINHDLVERFNLDVSYLSKILSRFKRTDILHDKLKYNIECLNQNINEKPVYLDIDSFSNFLLNISDVIYKELMEYVNKYRKLHVHTR